MAKYVEVALSNAKIYTNIVKKKEKTYVFNNLELLNNDDEIVSVSNYYFSGDKVRIPFDTTVVVYDKNKETNAKYDFQDLMDDKEFTAIMVEHTIFTTDENKQATKKYKPRKASEEEKK